MKHNPWANDRKWYGTCFRAAQSSLLVHKLRNKIPNSPSYFPADHSLRYRRHDELGRILGFADWLARAFLFFFSRKRLSPCPSTGSIQPDRIKLALWPEKCCVLSPVAPTALAYRSITPVMHGCHTLHTMNPYSFTTSSLERAFGFRPERLPGASTQRRI